MATYQQTYPNSCGASSLLCAAYELGVAQIPQNPAYLLLMAGATPLALTPACETQIYQVTSNNPGNINPNGWGYSMPSNIVRCARMLGLQAWAVAYETWSVRGLKIGYSDELRALRALNALVESGGNRSFFSPVGHQRELKVLLGRDRHNFGGMHYVMVRPNGTVMEPGGGADYPDIAQAKTAVGMHGTGLSIFIQI